MITIKVRDIDYKGEDGFEEIRDEIYDNDMLNTGCISADYSPKLRIGIFTFIDNFSIPERLQRHAKHYHPVTKHRHEPDDIVEKGGF